MDSQFLLSQKLGEALFEKGWVLSTAESCTGGGVATSITDVAGSSAWFDRAYITYSNQSKVDMLGVREETLESFGAVSEPIVTEMVLGALERSNASIAVSISGIAGPGGGTAEKPVGTVCFGFASSNGWLCAETCFFQGDRKQIREQAVNHALRSLLSFLTRGSHE